MVQVLNSLQAWKELKKSYSGQSIGFVPTMGNLHLGHLSLCKRSIEENDVTVVSIYVNPTQFNDPKDLEKYPKTLQQDLDLLESLEKVDYCLVLNDKEMYADDFCYRVSEHQLSLELEGAFRPGHFTGMLTVVLKLLLAVSPGKAYFGEKDYQQYQLIQGMKKAFFMDCEIIPCVTIRETSGLAFSSRNGLLSSEQRLLADKFASIFVQKNLPIEEIRAKLLSLGLKIDYLEDKQQRRLVAVRIGGIRLLDNYALES